MHLQFDYYRIKKFYLDDRPEELYQRGIPIVQQQFVRTNSDRYMLISGQVKYKRLEGLSGTEI